MISFHFLFAFTLDQSDHDDKVRRIGNIKFSGDDNYNNMRKRIIMIIIMRKIMIIMRKRMIMIIMMRKIMIMMRKLL